ncbi:ubiquitin-conjugating enzyme/RWD-like protein [Chytridium lagenaria]|nr:ubiquitin-conjugating enzyme/RWD-like protein [Chytridium lagenaria]
MARHDKRSSRNALGRWLFKVDMVFGEDFDEVPPTVHFLTVPFHPNIDMHSGRPCLDILDDPSAWFSGITIVGLMLSLQHLLSHPNLENPVNAPAAEIYFKSRRLSSSLLEIALLLAEGSVPDCLHTVPTSRL